MAAILKPKNMAAILDFLKMSISQPFEELQGWNSELKLITPMSITGIHFGIMSAILEPWAAILDF